MASDALDWVAKAKTRLTMLRMHSVWWAVYRRYENVVQQGEMLNVCAMMFCTTVSRALKVEYIFYKI